MKVLRSLIYALLVILFSKKMYDIYNKITYTLLRDYAKAHNATITIIDKNPSYVADIFSNVLQDNCFEIDDLEYFFSCVFRH